MQSSEQNELINKVKTGWLMDTENRRTAVWGEGAGGLGEKGEGIKQNYNTEN